MRINHTVRRRLMVERKRKGMSQAELAKTAGMRLEALRGLESGRVAISIDRLDCWLKALEVDLEAVWPRRKPQEPFQPVPVPAILKIAREVYGLQPGRSRGRRVRDARAMAGLVAVELNEYPRRVIAARLDWSVSSLARQARRMRQCVRNGRQVPQYERIWALLREREGL